MADNINIKDAAGSTIVLGAKDLSSVYFPKHLVVDAAGNILPSADAAARALFAQITNGTINLGIFAEDAPHSSAHTGIQIFSVRQDVAAALSGTDADYQPLITDGSGRLWTHVGALTPGTAAGNLGKAEDAAHTTGDVGVFILAKRTDAAAVSGGTDGDYVSVNVDSTGRLWARAQDDGPAFTSVYGVSGAAFTSADASGAAAAVTDAPTAGQKLILTDLTVSVGSAVTVSFTEETSGTLLHRLYMPANSTETIQFRGKRKLATADKKVMVQTSGAGNVAVTAGYYSEA